MHKFVIVLALFGSALAGNLQEAAPAASYGAPAQAYGAPAAVAVKSAAPSSYSQQIPAAAIRNVETVGVTKTITPVVTKTTTHQTHSEPALSVGHVQGYTQSAAGPARVAPVQFNTQYTQYSNPTVGVNGPVTYSGAAVGHAGFALQGAAAPVAYAAPQSYASYPSYANLAPAYSQYYGAPAQTFAAPAQVAYGAPAQVAYAAPAQVAYAAPAQFAYAAPAQVAYAAPAQVAYAAPAQVAYAAPAQVAYAAPAQQIGYSGLTGYQPQFLNAAAAPAAVPAAIEGGSYGGAQFLSEASSGLSTAYGVHKK